MCGIRFPRIGIILLAAPLVLAPLPQCHARDVTDQEVRDSIERAKEFLQRRQGRDGSWQSEFNMDRYQVGVTSLALLALLSTGMTARDLEIQRGLEWLRKQNPDQTYEISLAIQVFAAAKDGRGDL